MMAETLKLCVQSADMCKHYVQKYYVADFFYPNLSDNLLFW